MEKQWQKKGQGRFPHIFQPSEVGGFTTRNRVKWAACSVSNYNNMDGSITDRELARDDVIAHSGCGIITNQGAYPDPKGEGKAYYRQIALYDDKFLPQYEKIAQMYHDTYPGTVALQQLLHGGRYGGIELDYCLQPSAVPQTLPHFRPPREITKDEIKQCIKDHAAAAKRAIRAGFDGVEFTSFMGYLTANFSSKYTNQRTDEYGGSTRNRARFTCELCDSIREAIGDDYILCVRLNAVELMEEFGGNTIDECMEIIQIVAEVGKPDMISMVIGWQESRRSSIGRDVPVDGWVGEAKRAKKLVGSIPVAFGVRIADPEVAEKCLANADFDFWEVCRPFLADPDFLHKIEENHLEDIRPCQGDNECLSRLFRNIPYLCTVNARLGHEVEPEYTIRPAVQKKDVMVIGGGPAGMECAMRAAERGHHVIIFEKSDCLGGQANLATKEPTGGREIKLLVGYYEKQLSELGVDVRLNTEVTFRMLGKIPVVERGVAVIATGSFNKIPSSIKDADAKIVTAFEVLRDGIVIESPVVVIGADKCALTTACYLTQQGHQVIVVGEEERAAQDVGASWRWRYITWLNEMGIPFKGGYQVVGVDSKAVTIRNAERQEDIIPAVTIVWGVREPRKELIHDLDYMFDEVHIIGDAIEPRSMRNAIHEGYRLGARI
ncbi:FAD-dependent oxidoreductase [Chloroflexota bacterium]